MFVGSPVEVESKEFGKLGKILKKNNVAVDVILFGFENFENDNALKLEALVSAVNSQDNSHLVSVQPGPFPMSETLQNSALVFEGANIPSAAAAGGAAAAGPASAAGGVDPNVDPELAMALMESLQLERARQAQQPGAAPTAGGAAAAEPVAMEDEDALLQQALAMSLAQERDEEMPDAKPLAQAPASSSASSSSSAGAAASGAGAGAGAAPPNDAELSDALQDPDFIENLLSDVGLSRSDVEFSDILGSVKPKDDKDKKDKDKDSSSKK